MTIKSPYQRIKYLRQEIKDLEEQLRVDKNIDVLEVEATLRRMTKGFVPNWDEFQEKHMFYFNHFRKEIGFIGENNSGIQEPGCIYFRTKQDVIDAIKAVGKIN